MWIDGVRAAVDVWWEDIRLSYSRFFSQSQFTIFTFIMKQPAFMCAINFGYAWISHFAWKVSRGPSKQHTVCLQTWQQRKETGNLCVCLCKLSNTNILTINVYTLTEIIFKWWQPFNKFQHKFQSNQMHVIHTNACVSVQNIRIYL